MTLSLHSSNAIRFPIICNGVKTWIRLWTTTTVSHHLFISLLSLSSVRAHVKWRDSYLSPSAPTWSCDYMRSSVNRRGGRERERGRKLERERVVVYSPSQRSQHFRLVIALSPLSSTLSNQVSTRSESPCFLIFSLQLCLFSHFSKSFLTFLAVLSLLSRLVIALLSASLRY